MIVGYQVMVLEGQNYEVTINMHCCKSVSILDIARVSNPNKQNSIRNKSLSGCPVQVKISRQVKITPDLSGGQVKKLCHLQ